MAKRGDIMCQSPWIGDSLDRNVGPQWLCQHVDHLIKMANSTMGKYKLYIFLFSLRPELEIKICIY